MFLAIPLSRSRPQRRELNSPMAASLAPASRPRRASSSSSSVRPEPSPIVLTRRGYCGTVQTELDRLANEKYLLLTTFRKDGRGVSTPVWVARHGEELVVRTPIDAGKVKRIRRDGAVEIAPCDVRGRPRGESVTGRARLLDADQTRGVRAAIERKYGIIGRLVTLGVRLRQGSDGIVGIAIALEETDRSDSRPVS